MSKPRQIKRRKRKTGYVNLVKPSPFQHTFFSFQEFAEWIS